MKIIPNVRLGTNATLDSLDAYPKHHLIAIGTNGFTHSLTNRMIFKEQVEIVVNRLHPSGIAVYGLASEYVFEAAIKQGIPIYQYDSYTMKRNRMRKETKKEGDASEG